ncbi:unnamed protein product [Blepharisma stoltei]|uniref:Uncharacterized protein n=1 Tax=Blepharisma stoltei TaxID=1481888 RepID=A0AAU9INW7_9CILI|nr:unnamed protein product [Blepharisma stoltei]
METDDNSPWYGILIGLILILIMLAPSYLYPPLPTHESLRDDYIKAMIALAEKNISEKEARKLEKKKKASEEAAAAGEYQKL